MCVLVLGRVTLDPVMKSNAAPPGTELPPLQSVALEVERCAVVLSLVFRYVSKQPAPFRNTHGQEILLCTDWRILDHSVSHESADPVQHFVGLEVAFGDRDHFANWCAERSHCGIAKQGSAGDG